MKKAAEITGFLIVWCLMIIMGIRAGNNHKDCRECALGHSKHKVETLALNEKN